MPDPLITLESLGWSPALAASFPPHQAKGLEPGRVAVEDKHHYVVITPQGELIGKIAGKMHHLAPSAADLPKVGDWVAYMPVPNEAKAVIHHILPRRTKLSRKVAGRELDEQVLATNIDLAFVVQALDRTFNVPLLHRHLLMVFESGARPVVVLNKADLCEDLAGKTAATRTAAGDAPVVTVCAKTAAGIDALRALIQPGETVVFMGSSGVGKSTLINDLCGEEVQATAEVREGDAKGRHTTTWRELILLPGGGLVIDTPGMREFSIWTAGDGMREAFADLDQVAEQCRFRDCSHTVESGCAVLKAVAAGQFPDERYRSYLKLKKELAFLEKAQIKQAWMQQKRNARVARRTFQKFKRETF